MNNKVPGLWMSAKEKMKFLVLIFFSLIMVSSCTTETIFKSNFNSTVINNPPSTAEVGTIALDAPPGLIKVIASPVGTSEKWVQITRPNNLSPTPGMQCNNSKFIGYGKYYFSCYMYMPSGSGLATIQFEPYLQSPGTLTNFLHVDFTQDNMVRVDDNEGTKFGSFPRDKLFSVLISLNLAATGSTAGIILGGEGTSGSYTYNIPNNPFISQYGATRLWMGYPWIGSFSATNIVVTHKTN